MEWEARGWHAAACGMAAMQGGGWWWQQLPHTTFPAHPHVQPVGGASAAWRAALLPWPCPAPAPAPYAPGYAYPWFTTPAIE